MTAHGSIWWSEHLSRDVPAALEFYGDRLGWEWDELPGMGRKKPYFLALSQGRPVAGCMDMAELGAATDLHAMWLTYLAVDDVCGAVTQATASGGAVLRSPQEIQNVGTTAIIMDPAAAIIGLITPT